ncbi:hypothetical protein NQ315_009550 [Exocentrus adspersus]|uniref:Protein YIF1 n=1 Tax=Exocentrus adspersus TaxID=1586481 RepID=A0AAV8WGI3_9CUCU|nr:hypothetical protein NQ315_009550 [Exocentrus adspersus]
MNYNANTGGRPPFGRKVKRVSDVNAMGYTPSPYDQGGNVNVQQNLYPNLEPEQPFQQGENVSLDPQMNKHQILAFPGSAPYDAQTNFPSAPKAPQPQGFPGYNAQPQYPNINPMGLSSPNLSMLGQPIVQDMAMQYGQQLAGAGKTILKKEVERFVPVSKLKYYFAVDTKYVLSKLMLLFFPFTHKDWSVKYEQDGPVQPRYEINAPDLYIPTMAYVTYVLAAGLVLGMQQRFSPEQIGILASSALAWCIVELAVYSSTLYIMQVETTLRTLDLLAYAGYKYVGTIFSIFVSLVGGSTGYYSCLIYTNLALAFFLVRSLKVQVLSETNVQETSYYGAQQTSAGHKRRLYFLLFVAAVQPFLSWWLSYHLLPLESASSASKAV